MSTSRKSSKPLVLQGSFRVVYVVYKSNKYKLVYSKKQNIMIKSPV